MPTAAGQRGPASAGVAHTIVGVPSPSARAVPW